MAILHVTFFFDGCGSLKEKRSRSRGMRDRFGRLQNVAVVEYGSQDQHTQAEWAFAVVATDRKGVDRTLSYIETRLESEIEARVADSYREWL